MEGGGKEGEGWDRGKKEALQVIHTQIQVKEAPLQNSGIAGWGLDVKKTEVDWQNSFWDWRRQLPEDGVWAGLDPWSLHFPEASGTSRFSGP